jgi:hypothetical protein
MSYAGINQNIGMTAFNPKLVLIPIPAPVVESYLLLENGDNMLLENDSLILLEG